MTNGDFIVKDCSSAEAAQWRYHDDLKGAYRLQRRRAAVPCYGAGPYPLGQIFMNTNPQ
ncbi:MAG: hypothetical protein OSA77_07135 [Halioglobus sp.]|jgi:hypothetical protein|nr:hypothetical protein [Halioglobus sp.]